jgi:hypothetical protein
MVSEFKGAATKLATGEATTADAKLRFKRAAESVP